MEVPITAVVFIALFVLLLFLRLPIAFSFFVASAPALYLIGGKEAFTVLSDMTWKVGVGYYLLSIPLSILLGEIMESTEITKDILVFMRLLMGRLPGGLLVASIWACAGFGAVSGVSVAAAATISKIAMPELTKLNFDKRMMAGTLAAGGTLDILIPPSVPMVVYALLTDESVGRLYAAGFLPGAVLSSIFTLYIILRVWRQPYLAPKTPKLTKEEILSSIPGFTIFILMIGIVLGTFFSGFANINESIALGVGFAVVTTLALRRLSIKDVARSFLNATELTAIILLIVIGASIFAYLLTILQFPQALTEFTLRARISPTAVILSMMIVGLILGCFIDAISILVLVMPIFLPIAKALNINLTWLCILMVINLEAGLITPPVGLNLYVIQGIGKFYGITEMDTIRGVVPYIGLLILGIAILMIFPSISTVVPDLIYGR
jgi:tripartite ATP-independent transporter DctM subunit